MDIILEIQHAVNTVTPRGVGKYAANLVNELLKRSQFEYGLSFFKYGFEEIDRLKTAEHLFGMQKIYECEDLSYYDALRDDSVFVNRSYEDYIGGKADLFHFMNIISIPTLIHGKMVVTVHDLNWIYHEEACSQVIHELVRIGWDRVKKVHPFLIAVSQNTKNEILCNSDYKEEEIAVIYPGYDVSACYPEENADYLSKFGIRDEYIFFVGVFERKKNIVTLVNAFNILANRHPNLQLVLAGKPTWDNAEEIFKAIELSPFYDRIKVLGYVDDDEKRWLFSKAKMFVFPSICEGFGVPILEAFACGCPVITSDHPTFIEVGGDAILFADSKNEKAFAELAEQLLSHNEVRDTMREKGFERVKAFSWEKTAIETEKVYEHILNTVVVD